MVFRRSWQVRSVVQGGILLASLAGGRTALGQAQADDTLDDAGARLIDLEERVRVLTAELQEAPAADFDAPDRRVIEAEGYFSLGNYVGAATILLDVLEKWPGSRAAEDSLALLGECLYRSGDYTAARTYLRQAIKRNTGTRKEQSALERLVELALRTGDYEGVDDYLARLDKIPSSQIAESVPYVRAKYLFYRERLDEALLVFSSIRGESSYFLQSQYFKATIFVKKGDLAAAATGFDEVLKAQPKNDGDKEIQDLARLALGRIYYDRGQFDKAREAYSSMARDSKYFREALYESTWNSIKAKDFNAAYRALDLMILDDPNSPEAPELRLLMANLSLRRNDFFQANETFSGARDEFEPIYRDLKLALQKSQADPHYFENLMGRGLERFDIKVFIPAGAAKWLKEDADLTRVVNLATEVGELQRTIKDTEQTIVRLERVMAGEGKVAIFSDLAEARTRSNEVLGQALDIRRKFLQRVHALAGPHLNAEEAVVLDDLMFERARLEQAVEGLPVTEGGRREVESTSRGHLQDLRVRLSESFTQIQGMESELLAIEQYYTGSRAEQKIRPEELKRPVAEMRASIAALRAAHERVRGEMEDASRVAEANTGEGERNAAVRLSAVMGKQQDLFLRARSRMSPQAQTELDGLLSVVSRAGAVHGQLQNFDTRVDAAAERRLGSIKERLAAEKAQIQAASGKFNVVMNESQSLGGGFAQGVLAKVTDRFYDIVVQSDLGLVDVAWGIKDQKTTKLTQLITDQKRELKAIDDDFRSLLEEEK